jgi:phosphonate dehydrogenase
MRDRVVFTHWTHPDIIDELGIECEVVAPPAKDVFSADEVRRLCRTARAVVMCMADSLEESFLLDCPELTIVATVLKGYDNFDVEACTRHGVWFTNVPDSLTAPTAELTIGLLLGLGRNIRAGDELVRSGDFQGWRPRLYGVGLAGGTVGLVGMGEIGRAVARRLSPFDATLLYADPRPLPEADPLREHVQQVELMELLRRSDFVVLLAPLLETTRYLIDADRLASCKRGAYLVNVGRGSVVDEEAVAASLSAGHLAGYAAEVFAMEDWVLPGRPDGIPESLRQNADRTLFTPHLGSAVEAARREISLTAVMNVRQTLLGQIPPNAVNHPPSPRFPLRK